MLMSPSFEMVATLLLLLVYIKLPNSGLLSVIPTLKGASPYVLETVVYTLTFCFSLSFTESVPGTKVIE